MKDRPTARKILADTYFMAYLTGIFWIKRQPADIALVSVITAIPVVFVAVFSSLAAAALAGAIVATPALLGLTSSAQGLAWDRFIKLREMLVAAPIHPVSYAVGTAIPSLLAALPAMGVYAALLVAYTGSWQGVAVALAAGIIAWLVSVLLGFTLASRAESPFRINTVSMVLSVVLVFMAPVYYPATLLPASVAAVSLLLPTTLAAEVARNAIGAPVILYPQQALPALAVEAAAAAVLLAKLSRWVDE